MPRPVKAHQPRLADAILASAAKPSPATPKNLASPAKHTATLDPKPPKQHRTDSSLARRDPPSQADVSNFLGGSGENFCGVLAIEWLDVPSEARRSQVERRTP